MFAGDNAASDDFTVIEVYTKDRPGVLFTITYWLSKLDYSIHLAKISTDVDQVADVFYVRGCGTAGRSWTRAAFKPWARPSTANWTRKMTDELTQPVDRFIEVFGRGARPGREYPGGLQPRSQPVGRVPCRAGYPRLGATPPSRTCGRTSPISGGRRLSERSVVRLLGSMRRFLPLPAQGRGGRERPGAGLLRPWRRRPPARDPGGRGHAHAAGPARRSETPGRKGTAPCWSCSTAAACGSSELVSLTLQQINLEGNYLTVRGKGAKVRLVPFRALGSGLPPAVSEGGSPALPHAGAQRLRVPHA